jgi:hypothetical protein
MKYTAFIAIALGLVSFLASGILEAKSKPLTIINVSGEELYLSWFHKNVPTQAFFVYLGKGKDIRIKDWDLDKETVIFVAKVQDVILPEEGKLKVYRFETPIGKTVNVKIKKDLIVYPNALFGDLKETNIKVRCQGQDQNPLDLSIKDMQKRHFTPASISFPYDEETIKFIPQQEDFKEKLAEFLAQQH